MSLSVVRVWLTFRASAKELAPLSPIRFPVGQVKRDTGDHIVTTPKAVREVRPALGGQRHLQTSH